MTSVIGIYFRISRVRIAALCYFIFSGILTQIPLFNYLGYEFSAMMTIPTAFIAGFLTITFAKEHLQKPLTRRTWLIVLFDYLHVNFLLLLIPLIVISLNSIVVKNCAYGKGMAFYLLLPMVTMIFSVALALVLSVIYRHAKIVFSCIVVGILIHIVFVTYYFPQLFAYNLILGYFPGITYDETIGNMATLGTFREYTVVMALLFIILFFIIVGRWKTDKSFADNYRAIKGKLSTDRLLHICMFACLVVLAVCYFYKDTLQWQYTSNDIQQALGRRTESNHFVYYYSRKDYSIAEIIRLRAIAEYQYDKVVQMLHVGYRTDPKIEVYLYPSSGEKQRLIGTSNTNIAKPWNRQIHLTSASFASTFRHELVHIVAGEFGFPVIHASLRMAMNEGLAVATDWPTGLFTPHHYAAALSRDNSLGDVSSLFSYTGFAVQSSSFAYLVAGSFCRYLIERYGIDRFKYAFGNGNFIAAFGEGIEPLINQWKVFLKSIDISQLPPETVRSLFQHPSIFYRTCAREVAAKNSIGVEALQVKNYQLAEYEFKQSYEDAPTSFALRGIMRSSLAQHKYTQVESLYSHLSEHSLLKIYPSILQYVGDAFYVSGKIVHAKQMYDIIDSMNYNEYYIESSLIRKQMIADHISGDLFDTLYYGGLTDSSKRTILDRSILEKGALPSLLYISALNYAECGNDSLALKEYGKVLQKNVGNGLCYFTLLHTANIYFASNQFEQCKIELWRAKNDVRTQSMIDMLNERIDECESVEYQLQ